MHVPGIPGKPIFPLSPDIPGSPSKPSVPEKPRSPATIKKENVFWKLSYHRIYAFHKVFLWC